MTVLDFWVSLSDRLGIRYRHRVCYHNLWSNIGRPFQSRYYDMFRDMARLSVEKSTSLHLCSNFRCLHGRPAACRPISSSINGTRRRTKSEGREPKLSGRSRISAVLFPRPRPDQLWIPILHRVLCRFVHRRQFKQYK